MGRILLLGAGFSRNWGAPLANEVTGSLLGELHDDAALARRLRSGPFEDAFAGFQRPRGDDENSRRLRRLQDAVTTLFSRMNAALATTTFEFDNDLAYSIKKFLERFRRFIFTLNQDLLLETHYHPNLVSPNWSGVAIPGMQGSYGAGWSGPADPTKLTWRPTQETWHCRGSCSPTSNCMALVTGRTSRASRCSSWEAPSQAQSTGSRYSKCTTTLSGKCSASPAPI